MNDASDYWTNKYNAETLGARRLSDADKRDIEVMYMSGDTPQSIAKALGHTQKHIFAYIRKHGLAKKRDELLEKSSDEIKIAQIEARQARRKQRTSNLDDVQAQIEELQSGIEAVSKTAPEEVMKKLKEGLEDLKAKRRRIQMWQRAFGEKDEGDFEKIIQRSLLRQQNEKVVTEEDKWHQKAWRHARNQIVHNSADAISAHHHMYTYFGLLVEVKLTASSIVLFNEDGHRVSMRKRRIFGETTLDDDDFENKQTQWSALRGKAMRLEGERVNIALDLTTYGGPYFAIDVSKKETASAAPEFHHIAGNEVIIETYKKYEEERDARRSRRAALTSPDIIKIPKSRQPAYQGDTELSKLLGGKALSYGEIQTLFGDLTAALAGHEQTRKTIEEKFTDELKRLDHSQEKARNEFRVASDQAKAAQLRLDNTVAQANDMKKEMDYGLKKVDSEIAATKAQLDEVARLIKQIDKQRQAVKERHPETKTVSAKVQAASWSAKSIATVEKQQEKSKARQLADSINSGQVVLQPDQMQELAKLIAQQMQPQQTEVGPGIAEMGTLYTQEEMDAERAARIAAEDNARRDRLIAAKDRRYYATRAEKEQLAEEVEAERKANADTNKQSYDSAIRILKEMGDTLYVRNHRVTINSNKVSGQLARRTGIPKEIKGSINVNFVEPYFTYGSQKDTNAFICELPDFGVSCIISVFFAKNDPEAMIASSIMSERPGWTKEEKKALKPYGGKSVSDFTLEEQLRVYSEVRDALDLKELEGRSEG